MSMNERLARVGEIIDAHGAQPSQLIAILQDTQTIFNYLSQEDMTLIADRLGISLATVITHRKNLTMKLGTRSVATLTLYAVTHGIVNSEALK